MKSTLVSVELMARYLLAKEKLRKYLKLITPKGFHWHLRSLGQNFVDVVKVYCVECCKEFGSTTRDRFKNTIHNLFAKNKNLVTSCLTHMLEIGVEERQSSLVIIPNHKPLQGSLLS